MIRVKYIKVNISPRESKGCSIGLAPIQERIIKLEKNIDRIISFLGLIAADLVFRLDKGRSIKIKIAENIIKTPPSLLGIDRRIA